MRGPWPTMPLGDACRINPKFERSESVQSDTLVTFVAMAAVDETRGRIAAAQLRPFAEVAKGYTSFRDGDVLFAKITPCMQNGKAAIAHGLHNGTGFGSTEFHVLRPHRFVLPEWVFAFIRQPSFRAEAQAHFTGTAGQQRVPAAFLRRVLIPIPPLAEQRRIVRLLDAAEELRRLRQEADRRTADLAPALFQEMFGDPAARAFPVKMLSEVSDIASGVAKGRRLNGSAISVPYLRVANVQAGYLDLTEIKMIEALPAEVEDLALKSGDVVLTEGGDFDKLGRGALWDSDLSPCIHQNHVFRVRADSSQMLPRYFTAYLTTDGAKSYFLRCAKKTTNLASINMRQLRLLPVSLPPLDLQRQFAARVAELHVLQARQAESRRRLDDLHHALLHRAFRGEL